MEIPFIGGCYLDRSLNLDSQVCQNLFLKNDSQGGKSILSLRGIAGLIGWLAFPGSNLHIRGRLTMNGSVTAV